MKKLLFFLSIIIFLSCRLTDNELKDSWWKYAEGYHIGDVINFESLHDLKHDTIYFKNDPKAVLIEKEESYFGLIGRKIIIKSLHSDKKGVYFQK